MQTSVVARYRRQVKINEIGEGTSEINRQIVVGIFSEAAAREEEEMVKR